MKLYEIAEELKPIVEQLENLDVDEQVIEDTLESLDLMTDLENKLESIYRINRNLQAEIKALKEEIDRLKKKKEALERRQERLRNHVDQSLRTAGLYGRKFKLTIGTIYYQKDKASIEVVDENKLPKEYITYEPKVNKTALLEAVKSNYGSNLPEQVIDFEDLGFRVINNKKSLRFK